MTPEPTPDAPNPYAPPTANVVEVPRRKTPVYSPVQAAVGTFLGGPLPGAYCLMANYAAMGDARRERAVGLWGGLGTLLLVALVPFLPERMPRFVLPLAMAWAARLLVEKGQFSKAQIAASETHIFHSNWRVVGISLLGMATFLILVFLVISLYFMWGFIPEE